MRNGLRRLGRVLVAGTVLAAGALWLLPARPPAELPPPRSVLDMHTHVAGLGKGCADCFVSSALRESWKFAWYLGAFGTSAEEMARTGDVVAVERLRAHIVSARWTARAVLLALDGVIGPDGTLDRAVTEVYVPNDYVAALAARYPEFAYGASINPHRPDALTRLAEAKSAGAVLVKWIPAIMRIDPADPRLDAFYDWLVEFDLPLLVHVGDEHAFSRADNRLGDPAKLARPLARGVTVIAAHFATTGESAGEDNFSRLLRMLPRHPRLYADISSLTQVNKLGYLVRALAAHGAADRMLYGSDWPLQRFPLVSPWWHFGRAPLAELKYVAGLENPLDRDVALKVALGVPASTLTRPLPAP